MELALDHLELRYERLSAASPAAQGRLSASLLHQGQLSPVLVVPSGEPDRYVLIDGYRRVAALRELKRDAVAAVVLEMEEVEAMILAHHQSGRRRRSALEEGWLVVELIDRHGFSQRRVAERLSRSVSWVSRRLGLVRLLPAAVQEAVRRGLVPCRAAGRYLVPLARANAEQCQALVEALGRKPVSDRQVERLYLGWRRADPVARERIVAQPWLYLEAETAARSLPDPPVEPGPAAALHTDLEALAGLSRRARRRLRLGLLDQLEPEGRQQVARRAAEAWLACLSLFERLKEQGCWTETPALPS